MTDFPRRSFVVSCVTLSMSALILSSAALYNRYPLIFYDTFTYLADGEQFVRRRWLWNAKVGWPANGRPVYYGVAIWPLRLDWSLWPVVFVQALLVGHLIQLTLRCMDVALPSVGFVLFVAALTLLTPVSWHVSHIMPDIFAAVLILAMYLLGYCRDRMRRWELFHLMVLATSAIGKRPCHNDHLVAGQNLGNSAIAAFHKYAFYGTLDCPGVRFRCYALFGSGSIGFG